MLYEGLGSVAHRKEFSSRLAQTTRASVFLYSRYGHGGSDPLLEPRAVSHMHHEAQVASGDPAAAKIERPLLLGHSDGASIAIIYAGTFPDSLDPDFRSWNIEVFLNPIRCPVLVIQGAQASEVHLAV